jgi:adenosylcobinamide-GDP ribazoletransferase
MTKAVGAAGRPLALFEAPLLALEFLTVMRLRAPVTARAEAVARSQAFFPAVGLLLGGLLAATDWLARRGVGPSVAGWLEVALLLALTGALHADGLADTFDGLFGGRSSEQRLRIMRDPAIGAYGVCALVAVLALKAASIGALPAGHRAEVLVVAPGLSRAACVAAIALFPYARTEGLGAAFHSASLPLAAPFAILFGLAAAILGLGIFGVLVWAACLAGGVALAAFISPKIGGLTGDSYGAVVEMTETLAFIAAVAWF